MQNSKSIKSQTRNVYLNAYGFHKDKLPKAFKKIMVYPFPAGMKNGTTILKGYDKKKKVVEFKWAIVNNELHVYDGSGFINVIRINKDKSFNGIAKIDGVQAVPKLQIINKFQQQDGSDYAAYSYNLNSNTTDGIIYPSADPCIFELRYPQTDIVGTASQ